MLLFVISLRKTDDRFRSTHDSSALSSKGRRLNCEKRPRRYRSDTFKCLARNFVFTERSLLFLPGRMMQPEQWGRSAFVDLVPVISVSFLFGSCQWIKCYERAFGSRTRCNALLLFSSRFFPNFEVWVMRAYMLIARSKEFEKRELSRIG